MSEEFKVELFIIPRAKDQLTQLYNEKREVALLVAENFIAPLSRGNRAAHLRGKYKPSWEISQENTKQSLQVFAKLYKDNSCHHYHFGYPFYKTGYDKTYPGDVSDGILHTVFKSSSTSEFHALLQVDQFHPKPFTVPVLLLGQVPQR